MPESPSLVLTFPSAVDAGTGAVRGAVTLQAGSEGLTGVVVPLAEAFLVRDGRVVTVPMPQDSIGVPLRLAAGQKLQLPADVVLASCEDDAALPSGRYDPHVRVVISLDDGGTRELIARSAPLDVR